MTEGVEEMPDLPGDAGHLGVIRHFFLHPRETYSVAELAALWRVRPDDVRDIHHDELTRVSSGAGGEPPAERIEWADAVGASVTFGMLRPVDIERALGPDFTRVRPEEWRTVPLVIHLPRFIADALAAEVFIPRDLPVDARAEQVILEAFAPGVRLAAADQDESSLRRPA